MAAPAYTQRLAAATTPATSATQTVYVVPQGLHVVVRHVCVCTISTATAITFRLIVSPVTRTGQFDLITWPDLKDVESRFVDMRQALEPGEQLIVSQSAGPISFAITGYVFTG